MTESDTCCGNCGVAIVGEAADGNPAHRKPCPQCGSLARASSVAASAVCHATATAELTVITYPQKLLTECKDLIDRGQYGISVVVAHMACEVAAERALSAAFASKGLQHLEEPVLDFLNGYNLGNDRNRKLYTALTGDSIEQEPFWPAFKESSTRRNNVVHGSKIVDQAEADSSYQAARDFITHLKQ
jgi:hypothetical protein